MPVEFYRVLHFSGIFLMMMSLGGMCLRGMSGGGRDFPQRKWLGMFHGIGALASLIAGFGMVAAMKYGWQGWLVAKTAIWLTLSMAPVLIYRRPDLAKLLWLAIAAAGIGAATLAIAKPF
jgi:hypothetical protein